MLTDWIVTKFSVAGYAPVGFDGDLRTLAQHRGDHSLNPEMLSEIGERGTLIKAAVLIPIVVRPEGLTVLLTRRTKHLSNHPGQISFPGGRTEADDADAEQAALRETKEEIGLASERIQVLGRLDDYITRTGFVVTPVVGLVSPPFELKLDAFEVDEAFEVPLAFLVNPQSRQRHSRMLYGKERFFYAMPYRDYFIWGATAGMLFNLSQFLR
ncbi:MAG: 8-oxo-dGTP pyrophosphatase MutT (NUDIX family) [Motiliproteus sp.]|jgi:8-oxo-dGTP pyrophosphatase MutT (NUDIX family)